MSEQIESKVNMDTLVGLCKRRGFIYQSSEIYGVINGFFDYAPLGVEMRRNIKDAWWRDMVHYREDIVGIDASIIMHSDVWKASGHIENFTDPMIDCKESKKRYRADQLYYSSVIVDGQIIGYISVLESPDMESKAAEQAENLKRKLGKQGVLKKVELKEYIEAEKNELEYIPSPATGKSGSLTAPRNFNLMFQTYVGALRDESAISYLRPETAQGIFTNFKNVVDTGRVKIPFGIAQIGKAFRNEITPRNFIFRSREFEAMEIEYFIPPDDDIWQKYHREWIDTRLEWFESIGIKRDLLGEDIHPKEKLSHYSRATTDITFKYPFGIHELEGIAARGDYDLRQHQECSGKSMEYFDESRKKRYIPHVIEPALGVDRTFLALLCAAYDEDEIDGDKRVSLRFHPRIAPIKAAVFPLVKNKPDLVEKAREIFKILQRRWNVFYDESGAIGRRYRRMDEVGTPFGITVDFNTLDDGTITLRDRDTTKQIRIDVKELIAHLSEKIDG